MQIEKTVFIDTETTGLAGGTGTVAFMIGAGFIKNDSFIVRQYFMPDYSYEAAMLGHLNDLMREFDGGLVSFNGRAFDLPLITTRMTMNRIRSSCSDAIHLDLIYPARRFWKKTILSCSLSSLEKNVLGIEREDDVPGFLIPAMYFQYLRDRNFDRMEGIFLHNLKDIVSLASLIVRMWEHIELAETDALKGTEYFSMGKIYEVKGDLKKAAEFHEKACACCHDAEDLRKIRQSFAALLKKMKNWDRVTSLWEEIACESRFDISAHIELAKFHEHQTKDYAKALEYAEEALEKIYKKRSLGRDSLSFYKEQDEVLKRMLRLKRKTGEK